MRDWPIIVASLVASVAMAGLYRRLRFHPLFIAALLASMLIFVTDPYLFFHLTVSIVLGLCLGSVRWFGNPRLRVLALLAFLLWVVIYGFRASVPLFSKALHMLGLVQ
jgi:hypothetical protein